MAVVPVPLMDKLEEYVVSHESLLREANDLHEWESMMANASVREKCCVSISLYNDVPVQPLSLVSKESRGWLSKLSDKVKPMAFSLHRMIMVVYVPAIRCTTNGTISLKLLQQDTLESIDVVLDHPASKACAFVCRWPRAVSTKGKGLAFLASTDGVNIRTGSLVGVIHPFWEDKLSSKMPYERELPVLCYPLEEQDPSIYVKDVSQLRTAMLTWVHAGKPGSDVLPRTIGQLRDSASFRQPMGSTINKAAPLPLLEGSSSVNQTANPTVGANHGNFNVANVAPGASVHTTQNSSQIQPNKHHAVPPVPIRLGVKTGAVGASQSAPELPTSGGKMGKGGATTGGWVAKQ